MERRHTPVFDFLEMLPQPMEGFLPLGIAEFLPEFFQREVDDVVVMDFFRRDLGTESKPNTMQEINLLGREARRMWAQIKNMFLAVWKIDFECQLRLRGS